MLIVLQQDSQDTTQQQAEERPTRTVSGLVPCCFMEQRQVRDGCCTPSISPSRLPVNVTLVQRERFPETLLRFDVVFGEEAESAVIQPVLQVLGLPYQPLGAHRQYREGQGYCKTTPYFLCIYHSTCSTDTRLSMKAKSTTFLLLTQDPDA